jgi:hypothetical protein
MRDVVGSSSDECDFAKWPKRRNSKWSESCFEKILLKNNHLNMHRNRSDSCSIKTEQTASFFVLPRLTGSQNAVSDFPSNSFLARSQQGKEFYQIFFQFMRANTHKNTLVKQW